MTGQRMGLVTDAERRAAALASRTHPRPPPQTGDACDDARRHPPDMCNFVPKFQDYTLYRRRR